MSRTVYLHVGIAKTGTTYLQRTLYANRALLKRLGVLYPGPGPAAHFFGSLDLRGATFQGHAYRRAQGAWDRLVAQSDGFAGTTVISHETLAHASPDEIRRAVGSFTTDDVRIVITCRDLARQLPAMWQEKLKNRSTTPYHDFLAKTLADWSHPDGPRGAFWRAQHIEGLVGRWAAEVGPANVCVVTVPPRGAPAAELWRRFALATGLPDGRYAFPADGGNPSMGVAEAELLRRLNPLLADLLDWPQYDALIKKGLAVRVLGRTGAHGRIVLPEERRPAVAEIAAASVAFLETAGVSVVGEVADLLPVYDDPDGRQPADLDDGDVLAVALAVVAALMKDRAGVLPPEQPLSRRLLGRLRARFPGRLPNRLRGR